VLPSIVFGLELQGFSDVTYTYAWRKLDLTDPNTNGTVSLGELDLFMRANLSDRVDFLTEFNFDSDPNTNEGSVDVERLQIGYLFNDALKVQAGRFHNVLSYWNMTYHHGKQLYTTIDRPDFVHFEDDGGLVPTHIVGLAAGGHIEGRMGGLEYDLMGGNGPRVQNIVCPTPTTCSGGSLSPNSTGDDSKNKAGSFMFRWMPRAIRGLGMGISGTIQQLRFYDDTGVNPVSIVSPDGTTTDVLFQQIYGANLTYLAHNIEFLSEGYQFRDHSYHGNSYLDYVWYAQIGLKIKRFTPYSRFERTTVLADDPYFIALGTENMSKTIAGIRFDLIPRSSIKAEVRFINTPSDNYNEAAIQWAFAF
jgi:hypothetical protein